MFYENTYKILYFIIKNFRKNFKRLPNRTELIKLLYLTDLEYYKNYGKKCSELKYIYYKRGPWTKQFHQLLDYMKDEEITEIKNEANDGKIFYLYSITNRSPRHDVDLEEDIKTTILNNLFIYNESDLTQILKVVYTTEPMVSTKRDDEIDFSKVPLHIRNERLQYKRKRRRQLEKISKLQNKIEDYDIELLEAFKPYRDRANELI